MSDSNETSEGIVDLSPKKQNDLVPIESGVADLTKATPMAEMRNRIEKELKTEMTPAQAEQNAEKIELAKHLEETGIDSLTGLNNRSRFDVVFPRVFDGATRSKTPLSILYIDLDKLKEVNDKFGHTPAGDQVLQKLAQALKEVFYRDGDFLARIGGDEFVVLLQHTTNEHTLKLAQKLLDKFHKLQDLDGEIINTLSIGINTTEDEDLSIREGDTKDAQTKRDALYQNADKSMYVAKHISHAYTDPTLNLPYEQKKERLKSYKGNIKNFADLKESNLDRGSKPPEIAKDLEA